MKRCDLPSQKRYRERNPSVSFRLKKQDREKLDGIIRTTGKSLGQWVTLFIHDKLGPYEEMCKLVINAADFEKQIEELKSEEKFTVQCTICGEPISLSSKRADWETKIYPKLKETFQYHHRKCESK